MIQYKYQRVPVVYLVSENSHNLDRGEHVTLVQRAQITERETLIAKNAEIIVDELKKRFFDKLPEMKSLVNELTPESYGVWIRFEEGWFDTRFSPTGVRNDSMDAACEEFDRWFREMFGITVVTNLKYVGDDFDSYSARFDAYITSLPQVGS